MIFRTIIALTLASTAVLAASDRDMAEWVIRWEGRVILEGSRQPMNDVAQLPAGDFRIVGIDLTGAVMLPAELVKLGGLPTLRELYLPGPIWNPGGGNEDAQPGIQGARDSEEPREAVLSAGTSTRRSTSGTPESAPARR